MAQSVNLGSTVTNSRIYTDDLFGVTKNGEVCYDSKTRLYIR